MLGFWGFSPLLSLLAAYCVPVRKRGSNCEVGSSGSIRSGYASRVMMEGGNFQDCLQAAMVTSVTEFHNC